MGKLSDFSKYKAIETHYDGYAFRSRLEARWATFFNTLGIPYEYEKEGFHLGGVQYLPDFWLPTQDCWVEIKGQTPTEEETQKARGLAICTRKMVFLISGSIAPPDAPALQDIRTEFRPGLTKIRRDDPQRKYQEISVSNEVLVLLQLIHDAHIEVSTHKGELLLQSGIICAGTTSLSRFAQRIQEQAHVFPAILPLLEQHENDLLQALTIEPEWEIEFQTQISSTELEWVECTTCKKITIGVSGFPHDECGEKSEWRGDSPRIVSAYTAARQARFEHFSKGGSEGKS